jgi:hypothetical protein
MTALDIVKMTKKYKGELHEFFLDMKSWSGFKTKVALNWQRIDFRPQNHPAVPKERGIYVFSCEHRGTKLPPHGYILYVGITGDEDSISTLYNRYAQYVRHQMTRTGRPAVVYMLDNWAEHLSFYFCPITNPKISLGNIEQKILNCIIPPINKRDMTAEITAVKAAAF